MCMLMLYKPRNVTQGIDLELSYPSGARLGKLKKRVQCVRRGSHLLYSAESS